MMIINYNQHRTANIQYDHTYYDSAKLYRVFIMQCRSETNVMLRPIYVVCGSDNSLHHVAVACWMADCGPVREMSQLNVGCTHMYASNS